MQVEVLCRGADGRGYYINGAVGDGILSVGVEYVLTGDQIEVTIKENNGVVVGKWASQNVYPATVVTVTRYEDGGVAVSDDIGNTYTDVRGVSMSKIPMDHIPDTNS